ncbi:MAG: hypothetical protein AB7S36_21510, partial [Planctomycetota bacterium]
MRKTCHAGLFPLIAAAALTLGTVVGCASGPGTPVSSAKPLADAPASAAPAATSTPVADTPRPAQPGDPWAQPGGNQPSSGGGAGPAGPSDEQAWLQNLPQDQKQQITELDAAASWTLARAQQMQSSGQFERARDLLKDMLDQLKGRVGNRALLQNRMNELETLYRQIVHLMGDSVGNLGDGLQEEYAKTVQEARQEANAWFEKAQTQMNEGSYEDAITSFEHVLEIVRWAPYSADIAGRYKEKAEALIRQCQTRAREVQSAEIDQMRQISRELEIIHRQREEARRLQDIEQMWGDALFNMNLKRYATAERLCEQILGMDPGFAKAREMKSTIVGLRLKHFADRNLERRLDQYRRLWAEWYDSKIPLAGSNVEYPDGDEWLRIKARANLGWKEIADSPTVAKIRNTLESKIIPINFEETDFPDAIDYIAQRASVNIIIDPDIEGDVEGTPVSLQLQNLPLKNSLKLLLDLNDLKY